MARSFRNSGHFTWRLIFPRLKKCLRQSAPRANSWKEFSLRDGRKINLLGEGRLIIWPPPKAILRQSWI